MLLQFVLHARLVVCTRTSISFQDNVPNDILNAQRDPGPCSRRGPTPKFGAFHSTSEFAAYGTSWHLLPGGGRRIAFLLVALIIVELHHHPGLGRLGRLAGRKTGTLAGRPQEVVSGAGFELRGKGDVIRVVVVLPVTPELQTGDLGFRGGSAAGRRLSVCGTGFGRMAVPRWSRLETLIIGRGSSSSSRQSTLGTSSGFQCIQGSCRTSARNRPVKLHECTTCTTDHVTTL